MVFIVSFTPEMVTDLKREHPKLDPTKKWLTEEKLDQQNRVKEELFSHYRKQLQPVLDQEGISAVQIMEFPSMGFVTIAGISTKQQEAIKAALRSMGMGKAAGDFSLTSDRKSTTAAKRRPEAQQQG